MICNKCGTEVPDNYKFCTKCGNDLSQQRAEEAAALRCPKCGAVISPGDKFCISCGADLSAIQGPEQPSAEDEPKDNTPRCPKCGAEIVPGQKFCMSCGERLDESVSASVQDGKAPGAPAVEEPVGSDAGGEVSENPKEADTGTVTVPQEDESAGEPKNESEEPTVTPANDSAAKPAEDSAEGENPQEPEDSTQDQAGQDETAQDWSDQEQPQNPYYEQNQDAQGNPGYGQPQYGQNQYQQNAYSQGQPPYGQGQYGQGQYAGGQQQYAQGQYSQGQPYGQGQYQQGGDPNVFYAQTQPNYQQGASANKSKSGHGKTPAWVWVLIALLAAAIIFCILWFFVLPNNHQSTANNTSVSQTQDVNGNGTAEQGNAGSSREYVSENSEWADDAESQLSQTAITVIKGTKVKWRNKSLMGDVYIYGSEWIGNDLIFIVEVEINEEKENNSIGSYYDTYYTYVRFKDVYRENGSYKYRTYSLPKKYRLNIYDSPDSQHKVAGYATPEEAQSAAE